MASGENTHLLKHLEFIQITAVRMAANSFIIKGWAVTLVVAVLAFTTADRGCRCGWIGLIPAVIFWGLDAYYLRQERLFRKLYDHVRENNSDSTDFSMDTKAVEAKVPPWVTVGLSKTIASFYAPLTAVAGLVSYYTGR